MIDHAALLEAQLRYGEACLDLYIEWWRCFAIPWPSRAGRAVQDVEVLGSARLGGCQLITPKFGR